MEDAMPSHTLPWTSALALLAQAKVAIVGTVAYSVNRIGRAVRNRRDGAALATFDDRMLADIGLSRDDLRDAFGGSLWRDPMVLLVSRAQERRYDRRVAPRAQAHVIAAPPI